MDFGLSNDDVFLVWELINHVMSCTITSTEKKKSSICLYAMKKINKNFVKPENTGSKRDKWNEKINGKFT